MMIVVLEGSPNQNGSSNLLAKRFIQGAEEAGHSIQVIDAAHAEIHPCTGCICCGYEGPCSQKDDVDYIRNKILKSRDTDPNLFLRLLKNIGRNIKATGVYFLIGILLSALFQRYVPAEGFARLFGSENEGFGLLMAATIGVPLYACGGGTIPLLKEWLVAGMSIGSAASFMLTGPSTKITNLGALKIVLGIKNFALYIAFIMVFPLICGFAVNLIFI